MHESHDYNPYPSSPSISILPGAAISSTSLPSRQNDGPTIMQQGWWEEMNHREKMDRMFENASPKSVEEIEELNIEKSREEYRRLQLDSDWGSQNRATVSADNTDANPTALSAPITSEAPTAPETPDIPNPKSGRGLAKFSKFLLKPWAKARKALGVGG